MDKEFCFTVGVTLHIHATDEKDMEGKLHQLWDLYPNVLVADWELVEKYDPETHTIVQ